MPPEQDVVRLARTALAACGVNEGHLAIAGIDPSTIQELNRDHRGKDQPTDVLSFPVDGSDTDIAGPREIGDVFVCREHCSDVVEAIVHGVLHLGGMDHETDDGEMLALQAEILRWERT